MIKRPCVLCGVIIHVETIAQRYCGEACTQLARRRADAKPGSAHYHATNPEQAKHHRDLLNRAGSL